MYIHGGIQLTLQCTIISITYNVYYIGARNMEQLPTILSLLHVIHSITFARRRKIADRIASVNQAFKRLKGI